MRFCVLCGKETDNLVGPLCSSCFVKTRDLIKGPKTIEVEYCRVCSSIRISGKWIKASEDPIVEASYTKFVSEMKVDENVEDLESRVGGKDRDSYGNNFVIIDMKGRVRKEEFSRSFRVKVEEVKSICNKCLKAKGNSFEAIIQIRGLKGQVKREDVERFESLFDRELLEDLGEVKEEVNGFDYYFVSKAAARRLVSRIAKDRKVIIKETYQDERTVDGKRKSKVVFSVKL